MKRGLQWPIGIALVLILSAGSNIWVALVASHDEAFAVEPDYYQKAVHFDDEMALRAESARLGWHVTPTLALGEPGRVGTLEAVITDSSGTAISGASVQVLAMHNARASRQLTATLADAGDGHYRTALDAVRPGEWELRFLVTRGTDRFAVRSRVDAAPPSAK